MLKSLFLLLAFAATASAAAITSVTCDGITITDSAFVQCGDRLDPTHLFANAFAGPSVVSAGVTGLGEATARASFSGTIELSVTGGTGSGSFAPCLFVQGGYFQGFGASSAAFGGFEMYLQGRFPQSGCGSALPFTYDVPQFFSVRLTAYAYGRANGPWIPQADGTAGIDQFRFWDAQGNPLSNVRYSLSEVPEPSASIAVLLALCVLSIAKLRRMRRNPL